MNPTLQELLEDSKCWCDAGATSADRVKAALLARIITAKGGTIDSFTSQCLCGIPMGKLKAWILELLKKWWELIVDIGIRFHYEPTTAPINWTDSGGAKVAPNLATFYTMADIPTIVVIHLDARGITAIHNLSNLPALQVFDCNNNTITSLDFSGCNLLDQIDCSFNSMNPVAVDNVLCTLDSIGLVGGDLAIMNNSPPTAAGLVCDASLLAKGWMVGHD